MSKDSPEEESVARWRIGEIVLDERTMELTVSGTKIVLARKPIELLMFFLRNPGEVLTKEELFGAVWPGRIVSEASLTNAIGRLRSALGDETAQQLIKSVYGYGYRFIGNVVREDPRLSAMPKAEPLLDFHDGEPVPSRGGWLLRKRLGAGGGGDVWLATESTTQEARVFKFARDHAALTALKREITLSRLMRESLGERADIVRVLDWNLDEAPYFIAVDHCNEGSLSDWADANGGIAAMPLAQRLELLAQTAEALAAAHSVGVLHKDLKPSNLLLHKRTKEDVVKIRLSDFGSARLIDRGRLSGLNIAQLGFTQTVVLGSTSGTPLYLAPELLAGQPPTMRSDVYALGVILYQLVAGDLRRPLAPGWERGIEDPLLVEDIAAAAAGDPQHRLADASELALRLRSLSERRRARELSLASEREATATRLALERTRTRRSWWMALALVCLLGLSLTLWQVLAARKSAREANAVAAFLVDDVLGAADPLAQSGGEFTVKSMLDQAAGHLKTRLQDQPGVRAKVALGLAKAYEGAGNGAASQQLLEAAMKDAESAEGVNGLTTLKIAFQLAVAIESQGSQDDRPLLLLQRVLANTSRLGKDNPLVFDSLSILASLKYRRGDYAGGLALYEALLPRVEALDDDRQTAAVASNLSDLYAQMGRYAEAETLSRKSIALQTRATGANSVEVYSGRGTLGDVLGSAGRYDEALQELAASEQGLIATVGAEHPYALSALQYRAKVTLLKGDAEAALPMAEKLYAADLRLSGDESFQTQSARNLLGRVLTQLGRAQEAVPLLEKALAGYQTSRPPLHPSLFDVRGNLAEALLKAGDRTRALEVLAVLRPSATQVLPANGPRLARFRQVEAELSTP